MTGIPSKLPANHRMWQKVIKAHNLVDKTVHTAELASASKIEFRQFLLLCVLWKTRIGDRLTRLPSVLEPYHTQARVLLDESQSWASYCSGIEKGETPEGTFAIARYYQMKAATGGKHMRPDSFDTPVAKRTRSHTMRSLEQDFRNLQADETPSKTRIPVPRTPNYEDLFGVESVASSPPPRAPTPAILVPEDLQKMMFPPTKDEQIVNAALVVFLNALTIHFSDIKHCEWTMHRKSFVSKFEDEEFESRTDGYLGDGKGNPYALIEVKPIARTVTSQSQIQMQEGSQMASWIKNDIDAPLNKLLVFLSHSPSVHLLIGLELGEPIFPKIGMRFLSLSRSTMAVTCLISARSPSITSPRHS